MGTSTNAYLFFGFHFEEGEFESLIEDYSNKHKIEIESTKDDAILCHIIGGHELVNSDYSKRSNALKEYGIEIDEHCSGSCQMSFISVLKLHRAYRGFPERIPSLLSTPDEEIEALNKIKKILDALNYNYNESEVGWYLVSYWDKP